MTSCKIIAVPRFDGVPEEIAKLFVGKTVPCLSGEVYACPDRDSSKKERYLMLPQQETLDAIEKTLNAKSYFRRWRNGSGFPDATIPYFFIPRNGYVEFLG